ncbi:uncharacterized protein K460DRAFT_270779 [Cucurbitaria berberidis CBS 394.84]|uniref:DUF985 domain-containing protein n=1 Tax=Cucurbitaria berberidis CBS 394.84 TaxID=1168544 RepID=A0A9P4GRE2_9PLEO|nr:uncharacterized protein K460DRAFT_270779 [Cucurbitaria berberidis CBS 394.84]KAF1850350.1 hypothetical protein K460DRAFT_270779 [Cucurbitaria berberidis CBS 394.84]
MPSSIPSTSQKLHPTYPPQPPDISSSAKESDRTQTIISALNLQRHIEGGYFAELDRNPLIIPNPFLSSTSAPSNTQTADKPFSGDDSVRNASTSIYYLLTPASPQGCFHRNKGRTVHTLVEGRGRYVLIHDDEEHGEKGKKRVESFVVGKDVEKGEKSVWIVEGGKFKASYLLPMREGGKDADDRLLISETVIPGFEYSDHDFLTLDKFRDIVTEEQAEELEWLVRRV